MRFPTPQNTLAVLSITTIATLTIPQTLLATSNAKSQYGIWMDLPPDAITTMDFVDQDKDGVDDRKQAGPGMPPANNPHPTPHKTTPSEEYFSKPGKYQHFQILPPTTQDECAQMFEEAYGVTKKAVEKKDVFNAHMESYKLMAASNYLFSNPPSPYLQKACGKLAELCVLFHDETEIALQDNVFPSKLPSLLQEIEDLYRSIASESLPV